MAADYYHADTENGDHIDDLSEDGLFTLLSDLSRPRNTIITITPADNDASWHASVRLLADSSHEVQRSDPRHGKQDQRTYASPDDIARDLTIWLAARDYPGRGSAGASDITAPSAS